MKTQVIFKVIKQIFKVNVEGDGHYANKLLLSIYLYNRKSGWVGPKVTVVILFLFKKINKNSLFWCIELKRSLFRMIVYVPF